MFNKCCAIRKQLILCVLLWLCASVSAQACVGVVSYTRACEHKNLVILSSVSAVMHFEDDEVVCLNGDFVFLTKKQARIIKTPHGDIFIPPYTAIKIIVAPPGILLVQNIYGSPCTSIPSSGRRTISISAGYELCWGENCNDEEDQFIDGVDRQEVSRTFLSPNIRQRVTRFHRKQMFEKDGMFRDNYSPKKKVYKSQVKELRQKIAELKEDFAAGQSPLCSEDSATLVIKH